MKKLVRYWAPVLVWMGVIFIFSTRQRVVVSDEYVVNFLFFKTLHVCEYFILYLLAFRAVRNTVAIQSPRIYFFAALILTLLYAVTDEIHQIYVPTREGKLRDVIIDTLGGGIAWYYLAQLLPKAPQKLKKLARSWQII